MNPNNNVQALRDGMAYIAEAWKCEVADYPATGGMTSDQKKIYLVGHTLQHFAKTLGSYHAACRNPGKPSSAEDLIVHEICANKFFASALKLAEIVGLSAGALAQYRHYPNRIDEWPVQLLITVGEIAAVCEKFAHTNRESLDDHKKLTGLTLTLYDIVVEFAGRGGQKLPDLTKSVPNFVGPRKTH